jgi:hypothetical protein
MPAAWYLDRNFWLPQPSWPTVNVIVSLQGMKMKYGPRYAAVDASANATDEPVVDVADHADSAEPARHLPLLTVFTRLAKYSPRTRRWHTAGKVGAGEAEETQSGEAHIEGL